MPIQTQFPAMFFGPTHYPLVTTNLTLNLDSRVGTLQTSGGVVAGNNDPVGQWLDQSGTNFHVTASPTARPLLKTNVLNTHPVLDFDGSNDEMTSTGPISTIITASAKTTFVVAKITSIGTNLADTYANDGLVADSGQYTGIHLKNTSPPRAYVYNWDGTDDNAFVPIALNTWYIFEMYHQSGILYISVDGVTYAQVTSGNTQVLGGTLKVGGASSPTITLHGQIARVIYHNVALSAPLRQQQRRHLERVYNL